MKFFFSPVCLIRENGYGLGCHQQQRKPILRVSGKYRTVPSAQALQDQVCIGPERAKYKYDTCCWPWVFRKSSRLPLLVLSVLFCCRCFSLEAADDWRTLPMLVCPPWEERRGEEREERGEKREERCESDHVHTAYDRTSNFSSSVPLVYASDTHQLRVQSYSLSVSRDQWGF